MTTPNLNKDIFKDNAAEPEFAITKKRATDGALIPATGIAGATIHASATDGGPPIHSTLSGPATERATKPGYYSSPFTITVINAQLFPAFDRKKIFWVWTDPANVGSKVSDPVFCWSVRPAA
jgi:hypothetical protein